MCFGSFTDLYSSLMPYAMVMSGSSATTAFAALFMTSKARRSFGFANWYLLANLRRSSDQPINAEKKHIRSLLGEPTTVNPHHNPRVGQQDIRLLKVLHILKPEPEVCQLQH